jgi:citrate lyase subunit beta/citryl-CoA lyase
MTMERGESGRWRMRSKLFVPGSRPELFSKAILSLADAVCFDLEDAVLPEQTADARIHVREFLQSNVVTERAIAVRVNGVRSDSLVKDLSAVVWPGVVLVNVPKVEDPSDVIEVAAELSKLERERDIARPIAILPTIESPRGLRLAYEVARVNARVAGLQLGLVDLFLTLGISAQDAAAAYHVRLQLRLAAGEAGVPCFDSAFPAFADAAGFAAEAAAARALGFAGKSCIHPSQVATANRIFSPTDEEVATARRIVDRAHEAGFQGRGVFGLDGHMIDRPMIRRAEEIIQLAESLRENRSTDR